MTISGIDDKSGHVALFRCSSPVRNPLQSESLCRCFLRAFTRQPIGSTVAVFARSANCGFLLTANSGACARRRWSRLRLKRSGRPAALDRKGKCASCASGTPEPFSRSGSPAGDDGSVSYAVGAPHSRRRQPHRRSCVLGRSTPVTPLDVIHNAGDTVYRCF